MAQLASKIQVKALEQEIQSLRKKEVSDKNEKEIWQSLNAFKAKVADTIFIKEEVKELIEQLNDESNSTY